MTLGFWLIERDGKLMRWAFLFSGSFPLRRGGVAWLDALCCSAGLLQQVLLLLQGLHPHFRSASCTSGGAGGAGFEGPQLTSDLCLLS